jgi:hypothetical protein
MVQDYTPRIQDCVLIRLRKESKTFISTIKEIDGDYITVRENMSGKSHKVHKNTIVYILKK